jgi:hypothetical protein
VWQFLCGHFTRGDFWRLFVSREVLSDLKERGRCAMAV